MLLTLECINERFASTLLEISARILKTVRCLLLSDERSAMRCIIRAKRLRISQKVCLAVIPAAWLVFFIALLLYNDNEVAGMLKELSCVITSA